MADLDARARLHERSEREQWARERQELKDKNRRLKEQLARTVKLLKMTQAAMVEQQKLVDRYQQEVLAQHEAKRVSDPAADSDAKRKDEELNTHGDDGLSAKRSRTEASASRSRHSLPLAERPANQRPPSELSPRRRRSLPGKGVNRGIAEDFRDLDRSGVWTKRNSERDDSRPVISATETLRAGLVHHRAKTTPPSHQIKLSTDGHKDVQEDSDDFFGNNEEHDANQQRDVPHKPTAINRELQYTRIEQGRRVHSTTSRAELTRGNRGKVKARGPVVGKENRFAYVEVVRNKEERAALPGHDCIECRKYYEALDGLVPESEMKALCSRHRARFEPYQTPDDFWRLSFPDSHSEVSD